jgi:glycosyltransferase involved in cell wall biosynthesis
MSKLGEQSDTAIHGHHGLLVENNPDAWYEALSMLIVSPELRREIGANARRFVCRYFISDAETALHRVRAIFTEILSNCQNTSERF